MTGIWNKLLSITHRITQMNWGKTASTKSPRIFRHLWTPSERLQSVYVDNYVSPSLFVLRNIFNIVPFDDNLRPAIPLLWRSVLTPTLIYPSTLTQSMCNLRLNKLFLNTSLGLGFSMISCFQYRYVPGSLLVFAVLVNLSFLHLISKVLSRTTKLLYFVTVRSVKPC